MRFTLPVCLLLALLAPAALAPAALAGPKSTRAPKAPATAVPLTKDEKVALALLGQMAAKGKSAKARARAAQAATLFATLDDDSKMRPLTQALTVEPASLRIRAARELARIGDKRAVRPLLARVLRESSPTAREAMARAIAALEVPGAVHELAQALDAPDEIVRRRAAEAMGFLGEIEAAAYLIAKWEARSGDFPRVYFSQVKQLSYIQDYDVEVASTSFIADPIVGVMQPGMAMAVKVLATEQIQTRSIAPTILQRSLAAVAGGRKATDAKGWRTWWDANAERLLR